MDMSTIENKIIGEGADDCVVAVLTYGVAFSVIGMSFGGENFDPNMQVDRTIWHWTISTQFEMLGTSFKNHGDMTFIECPGDEKDGRKALAAMVDFLLAAAEAKDEDSENWSLFPEKIRKWAGQWGDELSALKFDLTY